MQLILHTDSAMDIQKNMSTLEEESLVEKLDDVIHEIKNDLCNSNKENIESKDNVISDGKDLSSENDKTDSEEFSASKSPARDTEKEIENNVKDDTEVRGSQKGSKKETENTTEETKQEVADPVAMSPDKLENSDENKKSEEEDKERSPVIADTDIQNDDESADDCRSPVIADTDIQNDDESADDCQLIKDDIEIVDLDDDEKDSPVSSNLDTENSSENKASTVCVDEKESSIVVDNADVTMTDDDKPENISTEEKDTLMEVDNITDNDQSKDKNKLYLDTENSTPSNGDKSQEDGKEEEMVESDKETLQNPTAQSDNDITSVEEDVQLVDSETHVNTTDTNETKKETRNDNKVLEVSNEVETLEEKCEESVQNKSVNQNTKIVDKAESPVHHRKLSEELKNVPSILKLSNTLDILSDDEEMESPKVEPATNAEASSIEKQCINIEDDDDIMLIDEEDTNSKDNNKTDIARAENEKTNNEIKLETPIDDTASSTVVLNKEDDSQKESKVEEKPAEKPIQPKTAEKTDEATTTAKPTKPLVPNNFLKSYKKNLVDMTRDELEEFCIIKIVESIVDRSNLSEIKAKLKTMGQNVEEYKKKAMMLTKQNRDLQVVLKSVQEEQKKMPSSAITPLKITRSVGMQVLMTEKSVTRKKPAAPTPNVNGNNSPIKMPRVQSRAMKAVSATQTIPFPRLVPAPNNVPKNMNAIPQTVLNNIGKVTTSNGIKATPNKVAEKRILNRSQGMTVDLTDDEPPTKMIARNSPGASPPVRLHHPLQQNNLRKVYIPISGAQGQPIGSQAIVFKTVTATGSPRLRAPTPLRLPNQIRMQRVQNRHPAPLPEVKQFQTHNFKALPPAPDLKLSKVENGIVISWKIEGYQEENYEQIASYQLYAYQESSAPPSTSLWKKIGDVKALPLPMACTLTQFMAGFKYYFAVRAVDIKSRYGPFSLPGSILLLNKI